MGKLSQQVQDQLGNFRKELSKDISGRFSIFENNFIKFSSAFQQATLPPAAAELYVQPTAIPREQGLPSMPFFPCSNVAISSAPDRQAVPPGTGARVIASPMVVPSPTPGPLPDGSVDPKLASLLKADHASLIKELEEKHTRLLT